MKDAPALKNLSLDPSRPRLGKSGEPSPFEHLLRGAGGDHHASDAWERQSYPNGGGHRWLGLIAGQRLLLSLLLAAIIPLILFGGWALYLASDDARTESRHAATETVKHVSERVASEIEAQLQVAEALAASTALDYPKLDEFYAQAHRVREAHPLWATVELDDPGGMQVLNLLRPLGATLGATVDEDSFDQVVRTKQSVVAGIGPVGHISGKRLVTIRTPVIRNDQLRYVLTVSFVPNAISSILKSAGAPKDWVGVVVDAHGNIIARTISENFELGRPASPGVRDAIARAPEGFYVAPTLEGIEVETVYQRLPQTGGWSVHFGIPSKLLNAPVLRSIYVLAGGGIASLALALLLASIIARDIAHRRHSEEKVAMLTLAASEEGRSVAVEAAELGTWRWDAKTGEVTGSDRSWAQLGLGRISPSRPEASISIIQLMAVIHPDDRKAVQTAMEQCLKSEGAINIDFRVIHPDKSLHWLRATGRVPHLPETSSNIVHGVIADIDPQKQGEAERMYLLRRLAEAQENEQRRIARELHDQVGQTVTGLSLGLKALEQKLHDNPTLDQVRWLRSLTSDLGRDIHRAAADLRPTALDDIGLKNALLAFASDWSERFGIAADVQFIGSDSRLPPDIETTIYRVIQEALTNVLKHAKAHSVSIVLERRPTRLHIIVEDDGVGFSPHQIPDPQHQGSRTARPPLGLSGIRERLSLINGALLIESEPGEGTTLFIQVPIHGDEIAS